VFDPHQGWIEEFARLCRGDSRLRLESFLNEQGVELTPALLDPLLTIELQQRGTSPAQTVLPELLQRFPGHQSLVIEVWSRVDQATAARQSPAECSTVQGMPSEPSTRLQRTGEPHVADAARAQIPESIGAYSVLRPLGQGGMGTVYQVEHRRTRQQYALKLLRPDRATGTDDPRQLFLREISVLTSLKHPRIVEAVEVGLHRDLPFLVMEYLPTVNLDEILEGQPPRRRVRVVCRILARVLEALHRAHKRGIVHRDIKPGNILVYWIHRKLGCKLGDFGLAKSFQDAGLSGITLEGQFRGTVGFMAPEQARQSREAGPAADLFSVAVCGHRLLTGRLPYSHVDSSWLISEVIEGQILPLHAHLADTPPRLDAIFRRATQLDPRDRYPSAREMLAELNQFVDHFDP
jgi:serine/threonine protein kinase